MGIYKKRMDNAVFHPPSSVFPLFPLPYPLFSVSSTIRLVRIRWHKRPTTGGECEHDSTSEYSTRGSSSGL